MIKKILLLTLFSLSAHASYLFIGNGGEGTLGQRGQIVLRDLYEEGCAEDPYIGADFSPLTETRLRNSPNLRLDYDSRLLARKINDLDLLSKNLGRVVLETILFYNWDYTGNIRMSPDSAANADLFPRFPLAYRLQKKISVDREKWQRMDDVQRVALIIHEAIYSLLPVKEYRQVPFNNQSANLARHLTGRLFLGPAAEPKENLTADILNILAIPPLLTCANDVGGVMISLYDDNTRQKTANKLIETLRLPGETPRQEIKDKIRVLCARIPLFKNYALRFAMTRESFFMSPLPYYQGVDTQGNLTPFTALYQYRLKARSRSYKISSRGFVAVTRYSCASRLIDFYESWMDRNSYMEDASPRQCSARAVSLQWR